MPGSYWFKAKPVGYGAKPANWKGWLAFAVFLTLGCAWAVATMGSPQATAQDYALGLAGMAVILAVYTWIKIKKTDGPWRWRTGQEE